MNPAHWVARHSHQIPNQPAIADGDQVHSTWSQFAATVARAATGLRDGFGLAHSDRVAIVMRNRPEYLEAMFAIWHAGMVAVPVNARLHRDEIKYILEHSASALVLTDDEHADDVDPLVAEVASLQASVRVPGPEWSALVA